VEVLEPVMAQLLEAGGAPALVRALRSKRSAVRKGGADAAGCALQHVRMFEALLQAGVVEALLGALAGEAKPEAREAEAMALESLLNNEMRHVMGGRERMVVLVSAAHPLLSEQQGSAVAAAVLALLGSCQADSAWLGPALGCLRHMTLGRHLGSLLATPGLAQALQRLPALVAGCPDPRASESLQEALPELQLRLAQAGGDGGAEAGAAAPAGAAAAPAAASRGPAASPHGRLCASCSKREGGGVKLQLCNGCKSVWYCSPDCQKGQWPLHKGPCRLASRSK
jgi:hypothetical protein